MKKGSKFTLITAAALAALMTLGACGSSSSSSSSASSDSTVITAYESEPQNKLIPGNTNEVGGGKIMQVLFSGLVTFDSESKVQNEVASSITANDDNTQYDIKLKKGWTFTDGTKVTASSFTKAWSYTANATNAQLNASFFSIIDGYDALQQDGVDSNAQLSGLKIVNDYEFTVTLSEASSVFPIMVGYQAFSPLPESFYKDPDAFGENPVGNGAYKFKSWNHNKSIVVTKNEDYKGNNVAKNDEIDFKIYTDTDAAYADVQAGNLDVMEAVPTSATTTFESDSSVQAYNEAGSVINTFTIPSNLEHFTGQEGVYRRQAISMAINREQIVEKVLGGTGTAAVDFSSPKISGYSESLKGNSVLTYNKKKAKELWAKANAISAWSDSDTFTIAYNSDGGNKDIYDAVVNSIKNTLGITAKTNPIATFSEMREEVTNRTLNSAFRTGWMPDYPSIENYLKPLYSSAAADGNGSNDGDYKNSEFDSLLSQAADSASTTDANKLYQQAEEILLNDLPAIPLYYKNNVGVAATGVKNFSIAWNSLPSYYALTK